MAISRVQFKSGSVSAGTSVAVTFDNPTSSGNFICVSISCYYNGGNASLPWTVTDNKSNTPIQAQSINLAGGGTQEQWYIQNINGGSSHQVTITVTGAATYLIMTIVEYSGVATSSSLDQFTGSTDAVGGTSYASGGVTTTQADEILIGVHHCLLTIATTTPGSGWNTVETVSAGGLHQHSVQDRIVSATGTYDSTGSWSSAAASQTNSIATFKAAAGGGGGGNPWYAYAQQRRKLNKWNIPILLPNLGECLKYGRAA